MKIYSLEANSSPSKRPGENWILYEDGKKTSVFGDLLAAVKTADEKTKSTGTRLLFKCFVARIETLGLRNANGFTCHIREDGVYWGDECNWNADDKYKSEHRDASVKAFANALSYSNRRVRPEFSVNDGDWLSIFLDEKKVSSVLSTAGMRLVLGCKEYGTDSEAILAADQLSNQSRSSLWVSQQHAFHHVRYRRNYLFNCKLSEDASNLWADWANKTEGMPSEFSKMEDFAEVFKVKLRNAVQFAEDRKAQLQPKKNYSPKADVWELSQEEIDCRNKVLREMEEFASQGVREREASFGEDSKFGDIIAQGEVYIEKIQGIPEGYVTLEKLSEIRFLGGAFSNPLQLTINSQRGHFLEKLDGAEILYPASFVSDLDCLNGPVVICCKPNAVLHEVHGVVHLSPGIYRVSYQREYLDGDSFRSMA